MPRGRRRSAGSPVAAVAGPGRRGRRARSAAGSDGRLAEIVERSIAELVEAVRQEVRRSVVAEVNGLLTGGGAVIAGRSRRAGGAATGGKKRVVQCIAPGCTNPSKGPRFHYLCEKHKDAKKADYETWRKARKEKQAA